MKRVRFFVFCSFVIASASIIGIAQTRDLVIGPAPGQSRPAGPEWLYVIGISDYEHVQDLNTAVKDAQALRDIMLSRYQFSRDRLIERYDSGATREQIIEDLYNLARRLGRDDSLFIYYAGHGYEDRTLNQGYWLPVNARAGKIYTYISNADIRTALSGIQARHIWLVSDSCFSGSLLAERSIPESIDDRYYREKYILKSRQIMTSGGNEPVADRSGTRDCRNHSVFACYFLKALRNNKQRYLTPTELFPDVAHIVSINSNQTPVLGDLRMAGHEGGEFVLIARTGTYQPGVALPEAGPAGTTPVPEWGGADTGSLEELEKRAREREDAERQRQEQLAAQQKKYSSDLEAYYKKVKSLETLSSLNPAEKAAAWKDFLSKFPPSHQTWGQNPYAEYAQNRMSYWEQESGKEEKKHEDTIQFIKNGNFSNNIEGWINESSGPGISSGIKSFINDFPQTSALRLNSLAGSNYYIEYAQYIPVSSQADLNIMLTFKWKQNKIEGNYGVAVVDVTLLNTRNTVPRGSAEARYTIGNITFLHQRSSSFYDQWCTNDATHYCAVNKTGISFGWITESINLLDALESMSGVDTRQVRQVKIRVTSYNNAGNGADALWDDISLTRK